MAFCPFPLFDENDGKQGSHGKVDACGVKSDEAAGKGAKGSTNESVTVVENAHKEHDFFGVHAFLWLIGAKQGIGLICEGMYHIQIFLAHAAEGVDERQTVEQVTAVYQQSHDGNGNERCSPGEELQQYKLHGACVQNQGDEQRPKDVVPHVLHQKTKGNADGKISCQNGDGFFKGKFPFFFQSYPSFISLLFRLAFFSFFATILV